MGIVKYPVLLAIALFLFSVEGRGDWETYVNSNHVTDLWADSSNVYWGSTHGAVIRSLSSSAEEKLVKSLGGLAASDVSCVTRDGAGRLWLGTVGWGLSVLLPGGGWSTHSTSTLELLSDEVLDLASSDPAGPSAESITVVGTTEGVSLFEEGEFRTFFDATDWSGSGCNAAGSVGMDGDRVLVGTECGCYDYVFSRLAWEAVFENREVVGIDDDGRGTFWILTTDSIYTYNQGDLEVIPRQGIATDVLYDIAAEDSVVWVAGSRGPARYNFSSRSWSRVTDGLAPNLIDAGSVYVTSGRVPWLGTDAGAAVLVDGAWHSYYSSGPAGNYVQDVEIDRDGTVWFATGSRGGTGAGRNIGILTYDDLEWGRIGVDPLPAGTAYCLYKSPLDGSMFVGFWGGGLVKHDATSGSWENLSGGLKSGVISDVYVDAFGRVFIGEYLAGLGVLCPDGDLLYYSAADLPACIETKCITAIGPGQSGAMVGGYLSPTEGCLDRVVEIDPGASCSGKGDDVCTIWSSQDDYIEGNAYSFARDAYGVTWMGTSGGLSSYETAWTPVNTTLGDVWDIEVDRYGNKWVATTLGIYVLQGYGTSWADFSGTLKKYDSSNSPLDDSPIKALAFDADGALWIGTDGGGIFKLTGAVERPVGHWVDVFPNPYYSWEDWEGEGIRFEGSLAGSKIRIFTVAGDLVAEVAGDDAWHLRNMDGREVVSGIYVYHAYGRDGEEFTGKLVVVR
jgi:hypothetical protein